jgi:hypothetical protein
MFLALLALPQEALHKRHLVYCVRIMSVGCATIAVSLQSWHSQVMLETCRGPWFSINLKRSASCWFHYNDCLLLFRDVKGTGRTAFTLCYQAENVDNILFLVIPLSCEKFFCLRLEFQILIKRHVLLSVLPLIQPPVLFLISSLCVCVCVCVPCRQFVKLKITANRVPSSYYFYQSCAPL